MQHKPCSSFLQSRVGVAHQVLLPYMPQINKSWWVPPGFLPDYTHLGSLNTRIFLLTQPGTLFQMMRPTPCFMLRWSLRSVFCCYSTQMSSAKVLRKTDLPGPNFNHQWAVLCHHSFSPVNTCDLSHFASPSKLLQISIVKNINNFFISPLWGSSFSSRFGDWASRWNSRQEMHPLESTHLCTVSLALWLLHYCIFCVIWPSINIAEKLMHVCCIAACLRPASLWHLPYIWRKKNTKQIIGIMKDCTVRYLPRIEWLIQISIGTSVGHRDTMINVKNTSC